MLSTPVRSLVRMVCVLMFIAVGLLALTGAPGARAQAAQPQVQVEPASPIAQANAGDPADDETGFSVVDALILGTVEGVTEYLPVSSTGHLHVTERLLGIGDTPETKDAADSYAIAIQAGAILAVLVLYRRRILTVFEGLVGRSDEGRRLLIALVLAFVPAVGFGLAFEDVIKDRLLAAGPIAFAWAVGGVAILTLAGRHRAATERPGIALTDITVRQAAVIGLAQCLALWPGTSRSLVTLAAGLLVGLTLDAAVEFAFLLGLLTLGAGTTYETLQNGSAMVDAFGLPMILLGIAVAFVTAVASVKWMVDYLKAHSLAVFGWYRLGVASLTGVLLLTNVL